MRPQVLTSLRYYAPVMYRMCTVYFFTLSWDVSTCPRSFLRKAEEQAKGTVG